MPSVDEKPGLTLCQEHLIANGMNVAAGSRSCQLHRISEPAPTTNSKILGVSLSRKRSSAPQPRSGCYPRPVIVESTKERVCRDDSIREGRRRIT